MYNQYQLSKVVALVKDAEDLGKLTKEFWNRYAEFYVKVFNPKEFEHFDAMMKDCVEEPDEIKCNFHVQPAFEEAVRDRYTDHKPENVASVEMVLNALIFFGEKRKDE